MQNIFHRVRKFGIGRFLLFTLVLLLIPGFILTVTLLTKPSSDALFVPVSDDLSQAVLYIPVLHSDIANQDAADVVFSESGDSYAWFGGGNTPSQSTLGLKFSGMQLPAGAEVQSAYLMLYSTQAQWVKLNVDIYSEAAITLNTFADQDLPTQRALSFAKDNYANDLKWDAGKYYVIEVTNSVREYLTTIKPNAMEITLIVKNLLPTAGGRKYFSTNIDDPLKVPTLRVNYTKPGTGKSSGI